MLFALYIFGLIITLGPAMLGFGLVVIGFLTSLEFWGTLAVFGFLYGWLFVLCPKQTQLKELKKKNQLDKNSIKLYWILTIVNWGILAGLVGGFICLIITQG